MEYLLWQQTQISGRIQHVGNDGEYRIPHSRYTVDGFDAETNTIYEFQGCFWHGCPKCYPNRSQAHLRLEQRCPADVYLCTQEKLQFLRDKGYYITEMWECDWRKMKEQREDVRNFVADLDLVEPLNPRDAFCGGHTNAVKLYHLADITSGEKINYYDFTSLYRSSIRIPSILSGTPKLYFSRTIQTFKITLALPKSQYYLRKNCFTQSFHCVKMVN